MNLSSYIKSFLILQNMGNTDFIGLSLLCSAIRGRYALEEKLISIYKSYLSELIDEYKELPFCSGEKGSQIIWTCWWQGEETMPPVAKVCINRIRYLNPSKTLIVLTKGNINKYLDIDPEIQNLVRNGNLSITFLSDYIRSGILAQYGGVWIDSTVYFTKPINETVFRNYLYTNRQPEDSAISRENIISKAQWSGFYIGTGYKDVVLFSFLNKALRKLILDYRYNPYYFSIDLIIRCAYNHLPCIKPVMEKTTYSSPDIDIMASLWDKNFDRSQIDSIFKSNEVLKLNTHWRCPPIKGNTYYDFFSSKEAITYTE